MSLLELFEKLLASLIILAMLVLIMFLAFDNDRGGSNSVVERFDPKIEERPQPAQEVATREAPQPQPPQQPQTPPVVPTQPQPRTDPQPQPQPSGDAKAPVPDPASPPALQRQDLVRTETEAPKIPPTVPAQPAPVTHDAPAKFQGRLRKQADGRQQSVRTSKVARKDLDLRRTSIERAPGKQPRERFIQRADYGERWYRNHRYECVGGECSCDCDRPYWSTSGPICED